jgi:hypothetical protein
MQMMEAEREALRLCPKSTIFLTYERAHYCHRNSYNGDHERGFAIRCCIWVAELHSHFDGPNWESAIMKLRNCLKVDLPQPCPDQEALPLPA